MAITMQEDVIGTHYANFLYHYDEGDDVEFSIPGVSQSYITNQWYQGEGNISVDGLAPNTQYKIVNNSGFEFNFTTLADPPRTARQSQWEHLVNRVKQAEDSYHFGGDIQDVDFDELAAAIDYDKIITYSPGGPLNNVLVVAQEHNFDGYDTEYCTLWTVGPEMGMLDDNNAPMVITRYYFTREEGSSSQMGPLTMLTGSGAPSSVTRGALGQLYTNLNTMETYQCTAINNLNYTWTKRW